jgi:protein-tyrosine phosphatase
LNEVRDELADAGIALELHTNAENFFLEPTLFPSLSRTIGSGKVLLVEAPYQGPLPMLGDLIFRMKLKGVTPLIAHPERCFEFEGKTRAADAAGQGALLQLDIGSLIGRYGKNAEKLARKFLDAGLYAVAATDLHSPVGAEKWLSESLKALEKAVGAKAASQLLSERPAKLLSGVVD